MSTLLDKQMYFTEMTAQFILFAVHKGYRLTYGETYRTPEQAELNAKSGKGIKNSLHIMRLAVDFNVFKEGRLLLKGSDFTDLGEFWESLGGTWGERFSKPDGNHFSLSYNGVK